MFKGEKESIRNHEIDRNKIDRKYKDEQLETTDYKPNDREEYTTNEALITP